MTALHPPILNLNRLNSSSGWPSDFRMSMLAQVRCCSAHKLRCKPCEMCPIKATRRGDAGAAAAAGEAAAERRKDWALGHTRVTSTDAPDWLKRHGLSAERPVSGQSVWCDDPPQSSSQWSVACDWSVYYPREKITC